MGRGQRASWSQAVHVRTLKNIGSLWNLAHMRGGEVKLIFSVFTQPH